MADERDTTSPEEQALADEWAAAWPRRAMPPRTISMRC